MSDEMSDEMSARAQAGGATLAPAEPDLDSDLMSLEDAAADIAAFDAATDMRELSSMAMMLAQLRETIGNLDAVLASVQDSPEPSA